MLNTDDIVMDDIITKLRNRQLIPCLLISICICYSARAHLSGKRGGKEVSIHLEVHHDAY